VRVFVGCVFVLVFEWGCFVIMGCFVVGFWGFR